MESIAALVGGYFLALIALSVAVRPYRMRLAALIRDLRKAPGITADEVQMLTHMADTAFAIRTTIVLCVIYAKLILSSNEGTRAEAREAAQAYPVIFNDPRMREVLEYHMLSASAVSPLFGAFAYLLRTIWRLIASFRFKDIDRQYGADIALFEAAARA